MGVDGIAIRVALLILGASFPRVVAVVRGIRVHPVEDRQQVERHLVGCLEGLLIVEWHAPVLDAGPYRIFPSVILVGIEVLVHRCVRFLYLGMGSTLEVHVQVLGQVPTQGELSIPKELLAEGKRQVSIYPCRTTHRCLHISFLQLIVVASHLGIERHVLWQPVQTESFQNVEPLALVLQPLEWFPSLIDWRPGIIERTAPIVLALVYGSLARGILMGMTIGKREIGWIVWHRMALGGDADSGIRHREVGLRHLGHGDVFDGVSLMLGACCIECILQFHIGIQRIVLRRSLLLGHTIIYRYTYLCLVWEELAHLQGCCHAVGTIIIGTSISHAVFQSTKAFAGVFSCGIHATKVGKLYVEISISSPATIIIMFLESKFIHPHFTALDFSGIISHTYHHGLHLTEGRITHNGNLVVRVVTVILREWRHIGSQSLCLSLVAFLLQVSEDAERHIEHVFLWPYQFAVG